MDEKPRRKRATLIQWLAVLGVAAVCLAIASEQIRHSWYGGNIPGWYAAYLVWQRRHGILWFPF